MKKENFIIVGITLIIVTISISLAYFAAKIVGTPKDVDLAMKDLYVEFTDNTAYLNASGITPGWTYEKTFVVENRSNNIYKYDIIIKDLVNTFVTTDLQYRITNTSENGGYSMSNFVSIPKSENVQDVKLAYSVSISMGEKQTYKLELKYVNSENAQNDDMGKIFNGTLFITEGTEQPTLLSKILEDNPTRSTRSNNNNGKNDFSTSISTDTTGTLFTSTESITGITDAQKEVYYYAGNTTNNWVKFGKYSSDKIMYRGYEDGVSDYVDYSTLSRCTNASHHNKNCSEYKYWSVGDDIYWRIIRTNHDSSIRLLYVGSSHDTTTGNIGESPFNTGDNSPKYVGYKYGEDTSLDTIRNNTTDSVIKTYIDSWYQNNLTDYTKYLSTTAVYCNDRNLGTGQTYSVKSDVAFASSNRLDYHNDGASANPTYNCTDIRDAFSVDNTSAKLDYPIGLMTADEIAFAGGVPNKDTYNNWYNVNSHFLSVSVSAWWSMTPLASLMGTTVSDDKIPISHIWDLHSSSTNGFSILSILYPMMEIGVRPVISLKSCTLYRTGNGTYSEPYEIDLTSSKC